VKIILVSNRLPIVIEKTETGLVTHCASGGLVSALVPSLKRLGGTWIGWPGAGVAAGAELNQTLADFGQREGIDLVGVPLSDEDYSHFYEGYCNQIIWPLFHDLQSFCNFRPEYWASSVKVQAAFAEAVKLHAQEDDLIWVQDYHLMGLGHAMAEAGIRSKFAFFLHIPFPPPDIFCKLPWRKDVLKALLQYEVIGLQTRRDMRNFSECVDRLLPEVQQRRTTRQCRMVLDGRASVAGVFPIGIDYDEFADGAAEESVEKRVLELRENYSGQQVLLGVDRLDYTKGVPDRLKSFARALERYPELHRKVTLLQVIVPSRESVPQYQNIKGEIEQLVAEINGKFTQPGWVPIHHVFRHVDRQELLAWYRLAEVALVTPLKDGMNLVAKEYCACQIDGNGVLVLSEFAGASEQMGRWAVLVNPYDIECVADAIDLAVVMTPQERRTAMDKLRTLVRQQNVHVWISQFLRVCGVHPEKETQTESESESEDQEEAVPVGVA
jgi:trehalose 6-phosphate synthase